MIQHLNFAEDDPLLQCKHRDLGEQLAQLQRQLKDTHKSMIILISGWEAVGKGEVYNDLVRELDPRYYRLTEFGEASPEDKKHPLLWRFFKAFPMQGQVAIFNHSFYGEILRDPDMDEHTFNHRLRDIGFVEELLHDEGCLVLKFFLDQSKDAMKKRIDRLKENEEKSFLLDDFDMYELEHYERFRQHFSRVLEHTSSLHCPWYVIDGEDIKDASLKILATLVRQLEWHLNHEGADAETVSLAPVYANPLAQVDLSKSLPKKAYKACLKDKQAQAEKLLYQLYRHDIPFICVFEGTDAAGKGGCIKRLTRLMDPRSYQVSTTAAPTKYELAHHYLWRFYRAFPIPGHLTIFDRSWYGRVLVERIEGFATKKRWQEAYEEINTMEKGLVEDGYVILKFLLIIDKDEQLKRFEERENTPEKRYKITDEDWRNREKFDEYLEAMNDMVVRTSTDYAPWHVIPSQDKRYARIEVLDTFIAAAEAALEKKSVSVDNIEEES